jgi:hypothetical protein
MKYLLPCTCGESIVVEVSQAGQHITCKCGQSVEVPTMRGIRALAPAVEENAKEAAIRRPAGTWSETQGFIFGFGALLAIAGIAAAIYYFYWVIVIDVQPPTQEEFEQFYAKAVDLPVDEMYELYTTKIRGTELGPPEPPFYVRAMRLEAEYFRNGIIAAVVTVVGLLTMISSFFLGGSKKKK